MKFAELELAFALVNFAEKSDNSAYVSRSTGKTFVHSDPAGVDERPDDIDSSDDYVAVPRKNDLDLGEQLVWDFVDQEIPSLKHKIRQFFDQRGANARFTSLLEDLKLLEKWNQFENDRTREVLLRWCEDHGIQIDE